MPAVEFILYLSSIMTFTGFLVFFIILFCIFFLNEKLGYCNNYMDEIMFLIDEEALSNVIISAIKKELGRVDC